MPHILVNSHNDNSPPDHPPAGYQPLPAGDYELELVESEYLATSKGTGMVLKCKAQVVGGEFDLRQFYLNYNLENQDEITVEIGQRDFTALRRATGVLVLDVSEELHFRPFRVTIGVRARKDTSELENVVKQYHFERRVA